MDGGGPVPIHINAFYRPPPLLDSRRLEAAETTASHLSHSSLIVEVIMSSDDGTATLTTLAMRV